MTNQVSPELMTPMTNYPDIPQQQYLIPAQQNKIQLPEKIKNGPKLIIPATIDQIKQNQLKFANQKNFYQYNKITRQFSVNQLPSQFQNKKLYYEINKQKIVKPTQNYFPNQQYLNNSFVYQNQNYYYPYNSSINYSNQNQSYYQQYNNYNNAFTQLEPATPTNDFNLKTTKPIQNKSFYSQNLVIKNDDSNRYKKYKKSYSKPYYKPNSYLNERLCQKKQIFQHHKNNKYPNKYGNKYFNKNQKYDKRFSNYKKSMPQTSIYIKNTKISLIYGKILQRKKDILAVPYQNQHLTTPLVNQIIKKSFFDLKMQILHKINAYHISQSQVISFKSVGIQNFKAFFIVKIFDISEEEINNHKKCLQRSLLHIFFDLQQFGDQSIALPYLACQRLPIAEGADIMITTIIKYFMESNSNIKDVTICLQKKTQYLTLIEYFRAACDQFIKDDEVECT